MLSRRRALIEGFVTLLLLGVVASLLTHVLRDVKFDDVWRLARALGPWSIAQAMLAAIMAYGALATYDLMATGSLALPITKTRIVATSFVSYAFNFNLGAVVGAIAMRLRLYGRSGVPHAKIVRVMGFCIATNWLGYLLVTGLVLTVAPLPALEPLALSAPNLVALGAGALGIVTAYTACCAARLKPRRLGRWTLRFPPLRTAFMQLAAGSVFWLAAAATLYLLLPQGVEIPYVRVLTVYLVAAVVAAFAHLPAGLGVLEGAFVLLLAPDVTKEEVLAAVLAFRVVFYLVPLVLAGALYLAMEIRHARRVQRGIASAAGPSRDLKTRPPASRRQNAPTPSPLPRRL